MIPASIVLTLLNLIFYDTQLEESISQDECSVKLDRIAGVYEGDCKKGLAHGNGKATGVDFYEGEFKKGYPHGHGIYSWENGNVYIGEWKSGQEDGKGKLTIILPHKDSVVEGYWHAGRYIGLTDLPSYSIQLNQNIERYSFRNNSQEGAVLRIKFTRSGAHNPSVTNLIISHDSGTRQNTQNNQVLVDNLEFPAKFTLRYTTPSKLGGGTINSALNFTLNYPGSWEIVLVN